MYLIIISFVIYDIKKSIIPNRLNFSLIIIGIAINLILSIVYKNIIGMSLVFSLIICIISYYLWRIGFGVGGDVKLITAISIFLPLQPDYNINYLNNSIPLTVFTNFH
ncbi:MAG: prepilin peptidase [Methanobrevibacter sp.]|nr:prepilin peptidase [Methanobrevibacter sp.]